MEKLLGKILLQKLRIKEYNIKLDLMETACNYGLKIS
jgi:hypothetical protein